jgi:hypothetical protein
MAEGVGEMRKGDWMQTYTGRAFWPLDPRPEDVEIEDIARSLSMQCRYGGHCKMFYSVAEHCCHICDYCPRDAALWGLLHDASEAYLLDVVRPLKRYLTGYAEIEALVMASIEKRFELGDPPAIVKRLDNAILVNERDALMAAPPFDWHLPEPAIKGLVIMSWTPEQAYIQFTQRFLRIWKRRD